MRFIIDISKHQVGRIEIIAEDRENAKKMALSEENRDKIKWHDKERFRIDEVYYIKPSCPDCKIELPEGSLFCYKCGKK